MVRRLYWALDLRLRRLRNECQIGEAEQEGKDNDEMYEPLLAMSAMADTDSAQLSAAKIGIIEHKGTTRQCGGNQTQTQTQRCPVLNFDREEFQVDVGGVPVVDFCRCCARGISAPN